MKKLTKRQIEEIVDWVNAWYELRNSAFPKQFVEHFGNQEDTYEFTEIPNESTNKKSSINNLIYSGKFKEPSIRITHKCIWKQKRLNELSHAIMVYSHGEKKVPDELWEEYNELIDEKNEKT
ncbi:hypothetical protein ES703_110870 [subsurface metagenome]